MCASFSEFGSGIRARRLLSYRRRRKLVKRALSYLAIVTAAGVICGLIVVFIVLPRLNWSATAKPGTLEQKLARSVISVWVRRNAGAWTNPLLPNPETLKSGQMDYDEHCAACHGLDGGGSNRFEAQFYPPVPKLTGGAQKLSDSEIYFIIANGIRLSAMPAFREHHDPDEIWRIVLWVRHLAHLSTDEKAEMQSRMQQQTGEHEHTMHMMQH